MTDFKPRPTVFIEFEFTLFDDIDPDNLGNALFDHLIEGNYRLEPADDDAINDGWSIDGYRVTRVVRREEE